MDTSENSQVEVIFDLPLIKRTGSIGEVLVDLMNSQKRKIEQELEGEFREQQVSPKALGRVLGRFVSLEGTKQPQEMEGLQFPGIPEKLVQTIVKKLVDARLLRESEDGVYELVHDTLANHLHQSRDPDDVAADVAVKIVKDAFFSNAQKETKRYLSPSELAQFAKHAEMIKTSNRLDEEEWSFVEESKRRCRNRRNRNYALIFGTLLVAVVMTCLFIRTLNLEKGAKLAKEKIENSLAALQGKDARTTATTKALQNSGSDRTDAFTKLNSILQDPEIDPSSQRLVSQLLNDYLANYTLFPFYSYSEASNEEIDDIVVGNALEFIVTSARESPLAFYEDYFSPQAPEVRDTMEYLIGPKDYRKYGQIRDMALFKQDQQQYILTAHGDGTIWKWEPGTTKAPQEIYQFTDRDTLIQEMAVAGDYLLVAVDSIVYELNLKSKKPLARHILGFNRAVKILVANPTNNGEFAVVKESSNRILMCKTNVVNAIVDTFEQDLSAVTSLAFSPDGRKMIAGYEEGDIAKMWPRNKRYLHTIFRGHRALISSIAFSPDGRNILTGSWDQTAILWTLKGEVVNRMIGHAQRINSVAYTENNFAVTCSKDGVFNVWDLRSLAKKEQRMKSIVRALALNEKDQSITYSLYGDKGVFYRWNWQQDKTDTIKQPRKYRGDTPGDIIALRYSDDGRSIVAASENWLTTEIDLSGELNEAGEYPFVEYRGGQGVPSTSSVVAVDINDTHVLIADKKTKQVVLRNRQDLSKYRILPHKSRIYTAKFSPNNELVLTGSEDGDAYLWDISLDTPSVRILTGHAAKVISVDFSPDGKYILTGSYDNSASLYELSSNFTDKLTPKIRLEGIRPDFRGHNSDVNVVAFANEVRPDGSYLFTTSSADRTGKFWELKDGSLRELPSVMRHQDEITLAGFLPGDSLIVTGGLDEILKVWPAGNVGQLIADRVARK